MAASGKIDCRKAERLLEDIKRKPRNQSPDDLRRAAEALAYFQDRKRGKGSHIWMRGGGPPFPIPTTKNPVRIGTTKSIVGVLEQVFDDECGNRRSN